ncbi:testis-expressed protein 2 [Aplysia californica]|uniref:Testis-expressed protein 2 n=1 Tax=Aplysia californica TaxID=6500 RepID=A0ABM1A2N9_APLCA|nr:testis-expressed protein 2 [Aplysia californica]XP_005101303.1 testis-expressed protein 2 [Aplysia californica]XP_012939625.1 testis-expressed protein 2 [Aplysia californica]XP_012939626.1 testis-expressed protein 2 [Aplysia californica]
MSFKKGLGKPSRPPPPKQGQGKGSVSLSGFSFKQLEEDEDDEDLTAFTGKYDKLVEESHRVQKQKPSSERTFSSSSVSSTSSAPAELRSLEQQPEKVVSGGSSSVDGVGVRPPLLSTGSFPMDKPPLKPAISLPVDVAAHNSPIRERAKAKLETSKEIFSGLKGKITDKISRTIEEFSGDSSSSPSPEKEKQKLLPVEKPSEREPVVKENVTLFRSSGIVEDHPLAHLEVEDDFEDVIEDVISASLQKEPSTEDDTLVFHEPEGRGTPDSEMLMFEEHFISEPTEDFTGMPGLSTSTQLKSRSKIKRFMKKKEPMTSAVAHMSALHFTPDEDLAKPLFRKPTSDDSQADNTASQGAAPEKSEVPSSPFSDSTANAILRQLSFADNRPVPVQKLIVISLFVFAYLILPLPSYMSGFIMGSLLATASCGFYLWLMEPPPPSEPFTLPPVEDLPPPPVPEMKVGLEGEECRHKGWMNELTDYTVENYHINKTHCVFISLEGTHLRLQRPKNPVPKRAMWDESFPKPQFIHQRHFDLPGSSVYLLPQGLVKKRIWSKKYPICISLTSAKGGVSSNGEDAATSKLKHILSEPIIGAKKEKVSDMGFEIITEEKCDSNVLYLFARTGREKEEWFKRFSAAAAGIPLGNHVMDMKRAVGSNSSPPPKKSSEVTPRHKREGSTDSITSASSLPDIAPEVNGTKEDSQGVSLLTFAHYMGRLMPAGLSSRLSSPTHTAPVKDIGSSKEGKDGAKSQPASKDEEEAIPISQNGSIVCDSQLFWVNALIGRCFFDFLRDKWWIGKVTEKLQRKLNKIHVPYFIEELQVTDIHMGYEIPAIRHAGRPYMDEKGFWVDLDITYSGGFTMTIETKMNLMKLKKSPHASNSPGRSVDSKSPVTDSDEEDSAESSTDEEEETPATGEDGSSGGGTSKKFLRYLNKITQSRYFQQATEYKVIKRAMENVSNTRLTLTVTVNSLVGKLALNIPPPPSDRLWYGFRGNPRLRLSAKPQVGERAVTITHITEWIEKKLALEFQRVFVMPNMDDLVIPILVPGEVNGVTISRSVSL